MVIPIKFYFFKSRCIQKPFVIVPQKHMCVVNTPYFKISFFFTVKEVNDVVASSFTKIVNHEKPGKIICVDCWDKSWFFVPLVIRCPACQNQYAIFS